MKTRLISALAVCCALLTGCGEDNKVNPPATSEIPELPSDPQEGNTSFKHRIMLLQHTGVECVNCPFMMVSLKELSEDKAYNNLYNHVAAHSYSTNDPAYSDAASKVSRAFGHSFWPDLTFNLTKDNLEGTTDIASIRHGIDKRVKDHADAGICAAVKKYGDKLGIKVGIKAAKTNTYRIAVWLLEDDIEAEQKGATASWQNIHENALRAMAGESLNMQIYGENLGMVNAGETAGKSFTMELDGSWKTENCKVLVIVNADDSNGKYDLANSVVCPIDSTVEYEYN